MPNSSGLKSLTFLFVLLAIFSTSYAQTTIEIDDITGRTYVSKQNKSSTSMTLYPIPANSHLRVVLPTGFKPHKLEIRKATGELIFSADAQQERVFQVDLLAGRYICEVYGNGSAQKGEKAGLEVLSKWFLIDI